jgi:hypothetical protein
VNRTEELLTETLTDESRALPVWADPVERVRSARRAQRRRRVGTAVGVVALAGVLGVAAPLVRGEQRAGDTRPAPVASDPQRVVTQERPVAVVSATFVGSEADETPFDAVVRHADGIVHATEKDAEGRWRLWPVRTEPGGRTTSPGSLQVPTRLPVRGRTVVASGPAVVAGFELHLPDEDGRLQPLRRPGCEPPQRCVPVRAAVSTPTDLFYAEDGDGPDECVVRRVRVLHGPRSVAQELARIQDGCSALVFDGTRLWALVTNRVGPAVDGSSLVQVDPRTLRVGRTVRLPGNLVEGAVAAGDGAVWAAVTGVDPTGVTTGGVVRVDGESGAVGPMVPTPFPLAMDYAEGTVWLAGSKLARLDARTNQLVGEPVRLDGASGVAADGRYVWVAGQDLVRYDWQYAS